jgi:asparagine synthase (glutamine-hydrolysing)
MCRINGIFRFSSGANIDLESEGLRLRDLMQHGGPDDAGHYFDAENEIFLGHRRLSILDLSAAGHQPMHFEDYAIVYNGEIYNFSAIKNDLTLLGYSFATGTDTEVILKAFDKWGYDCVNRFRGMFAFAIWDKKNNKLIVCRDRVGVKPLHYYCKDGIFIFASEIKSVSSFPNLDLTIDQHSVSSFLQVGYIKSPNSIFKNIKKLNPGHFLEIDKNGDCKTWSYWDAGNIQYMSTELRDEEILERTENLLQESCSLRMVSDVPVGVFLSGGIDSSLVTALLSKDSTTRLKTFTIGFEDPAFDESSHAQAVSKHFGTDHTEMRCTANDFLNTLDSYYEMYDEPFGDSSGIPTLLVSKLAREKVTVSLSADGGDEVFGGYDRYSSVSSIYGKLRFIPLPLRKMLGEALSSMSISHIDSLIRTFFKGYDANGLDWRIPKLVNGLKASSQVNFYGNTSSAIDNDKLVKLHRYDAADIYFPEKELFNDQFVFSSLGKIDVKSYLEGDILTKVDRATMKVALEGREPLLDHTLVEFGLSLPDKFKSRDGKNKWLLREILYKYIPKEIVDRPKRGFSIPVKKWLQSHLSSSLLDMSNDRYFHEKFMLDSEELKSIISGFLNGTGKHVNPHFIWHLHVLYKWNQTHQ